MRENFDKSINVLFRIEGYESNNPVDKGGYTKYGLASRYHTDIDFEKLTREKAVEIYRERYWKPLKCDELEYPIDMVLFVQGVHLGVGRAKEYMENSDGLFGFFMSCLRHYCTRDEEQRKAFLHGWCNRLLKLWEAI